MTFYSNINFIDKSILCLAAFLIFSTSIASAQERIYTVTNAHAHNDYNHPVPFFTAYNAGFGSIEVDVFFRNNELYVAHDTAGITRGRTLRSLYLNPLSGVIKSNNGYVYKDSLKKLLLLIDLKAIAEPALRKVVKQLKRYKEITGCATLKIVITGNQPALSTLTSYPDYIHFDGKLSDTYTAEALQRIALFSDNFSNYTKWNGEGIPVEQDRLRIDSAVKKAHALNKPIRFWAAPDSPNAWNYLMRANVDYINTDKIYEISTFMEKLPVNTSQSSNGQPVNK